MKPLLRDTYCGVDIILVQSQNTGYRLLAIYANILGSCSFYGYNRQRIFEARYMIKNSSKSRKQRKHNENNVEYKEIIVKKKLVESWTAHWIPKVIRQSMYMYFCYLISFNKIIDFGIDFRQNHGL